MIADASGASKPDLLYLSPVVPALGGNGLAMRAGMVLQVLARHYRISLLVVRLYAPYAAPIPIEIAGLCCRTADLPAAPALAGRSTTSLRQRLVAAVRRRVLGGDTTNRAFPNVPFQVVHVFRMAMLPHAQPYLDALGHRAKLHLDLDDIESITRGRLAELYRTHGNSALAHAEDQAAQRAAALELEALRTFDRVYVCSEGDQAELRRRGRAQVCVLPNALPVPQPLPPQLTDGTFTFLFVGTLGYYPNEDALLFFCAAVLPLIRQAAPRPFRFAIVGSGASPAVRRLAGVPEVQVIGAVPAVAPWYAAANAVVVPIRAGGGTRIKVLEAWSYRRPVVSTRIGIEGIAARAEEHVLLGDTPAAFAEHCLRLMADGQLAERLTTNAYDLFLQQYTIEAVARQFAAFA